MLISRLCRAMGALVGLTFAVVMAGSLGGPVAQAAPTGYNAWTLFEEAPAGGGTTYGATGEQAGLQLRTIRTQYRFEVEVAAVPAGRTLANPAFRATFGYYVGEGLVAGAETYSANRGSGTLVVERDGDPCGPPDQAVPTEYQVPRGEFQVHELELDHGGQVTRFSASYQLNCQRVGGPPSFGAVSS